jgi:hypothetical protein
MSGEDFVRSLQVHVPKPVGVPSDAIFMTVTVNCVASRNWIWVRKNVRYFFDERTGKSFSTPK